MVDEFGYLSQFSSQIGGGFSDLSSSGNQIYTGTDKQQYRQYLDDRFAGQAPTNPLLSVSKKYQFGNIQTPQLFAEFGRSAAAGPIQDIYNAQVGASVEGSYGAFAEAMRSAEASSRASGVPDYVARERVNNLRPLFESQAAQGVYGAAAQRGENLFGL